MVDGPEFYSSLEEASLRERQQTNRLFWDALKGARKSCSKRPLKTRPISEFMSVFPFSLLSVRKQRVDKTIRRNLAHVATHTASSQAGKSSGKNPGKKKRKKTVQVETVVQKKAKRSKSKLKSANSKSQTLLPCSKGKRYSSPSAVKTTEKAVCFVSSSAVSDLRSSSSSSGSASRPRVAPASPCSISVSSKSTAVSTTPSSPGSCDTSISSAPQPPQSTVTSASSSLLRYFNKLPTASVAPPNTTPGSEKAKSGSPFVVNYEGAITKMKKVCITKWADDQTADNRRNSSTSTTSASTAAEPTSPPFASSFSPSAPNSSLSAAHSSTPPPCLPVWFSNSVSEHVNFYDRLHFEIVHLLNWIHPTAEEERLRREAIARLEFAAQSLWPTAKAFAFGSVRTGLYLPQSDLDISIEGVANVFSHRQKAGRPLSELGRRVTHWGIAYENSIELVRFARVPLVKYVDIRTGIRVDVSLATSSAKPTSEYIREQVERFPSLRPLIILNKLILAQTGLNEPFRGGMGSYLLSCLCLRFLQLEDEKRQIGDRASQSLGEALHRFFRLYGVDFPYDGFGIRVHGPHGGTFQKRGHQYARCKLVVESPLDPTLNLGSSAYKMARIIELWKQGWEALEMQLKCYEPARNCSILASLINFRDPLFFQRTPQRQQSRRQPASASSETSQTPIPDPLEVSAEARLKVVEELMASNVDIPADLIRLCVKKCSSDHPSRSRNTPPLPDSCSDEESSSKRPATPPRIVTCFSSPPSDDDQDDSRSFSVGLCHASAGATPARSPFGPLLPLPVYPFPPGHFSQAQFGRQWQFRARLS